MKNRTAVSAQDAAAFPSLFSVNPLISSRAPSLASSSPSTKLSRIAPVSTSPTASATWLAMFWLIYIEKIFFFDFLPCINKILSIRHAKNIIIITLLSNLLEPLAKNTGDDSKNTKNLHFAWDSQKLTKSCSASDKMKCLDKRWPRQW